MPTYKIKHGDTKIIQTLTYSANIMRTMTPRWVYRGMRRDVVSAGKLGNPHFYRAVVPGAQTIGEPKALITEHEIGSGGTTYELITATNPWVSGNIPAAAGGDGFIDHRVTAASTVEAHEDTLFNECDDINHISSRPNPELVTMVEYWETDTEPGFTFQCHAALTQGSTIVTLASNVLVTVGQVFSNITGSVFAGNPSAVHVMEVLYVPELADGTTETGRAGTKIRVSHPASTTVAMGGTDMGQLLSFNGAIRLGGHSVDYSLADGGEFSILT